MKRVSLLALGVFITVLTLPCGAQPPVITSFGQNGELVCTNLAPGTVATVEWAASLDGPWTNTWAELEALTVGSNGMIRVDVPMFYRVRVVSLNPDPAKLVWIPAGTFAMGSPTNEPARLDDEGPQTTVTISRGFWMGKHEVTQGEYLNVMGSNPSYFNGDRSGDPYYDMDYGFDLTRPVERVSWSDATNYCARLTDRDRLAGRLPAGCVYRLPTEAEWEYGCRAETMTPYHYGYELRSGMANFDGHYEYPPCEGGPNYCYNPSGNYPRRTIAVEGYGPNAWGLYDMHGNVGEWCLDWYTGSLPGGSVTDPQGPGSGSNRVIRGGSWYDMAHSCRSAYRNSRYPVGYRDFNQGFRVVLVQVP
jgi:formylglycine-generating enzyme required for sulfatase activity